MRNRRNHYRILQVQPGAPAEIIRASYRTLMQRMRLHPDLGGSHRHAALINEAYAVLSDPDRRARYDRELGARLADSRRQAGTRPATDTDSHEGKPAPADGGCLFCGAPCPRHPETRPDARCQRCDSPLAMPPSRAAAGDDQRLMQRLPRDQQLQVFCHWPGTPIAARSRDISPAGIRFVAQQPFPPRSILKLKGAGWDAVAQVINIRREPAGGTWLVGARFLGIIFSHSRGAFFSAEA
ncbi:MAG: J domain-containing protein [Gammaproteobacteria bacterium]|nr:J domain-containing protein [Gammaproteobacteria bacterium]